MLDVTSIEITPLSSACGAEISGVDLSRPLPTETVRAIRDAWNTYIVLVFRGQTVSQDDQLRFASYFGELGERKRAKTQLAKKIEGTQQTNKNILLVTNIKENGVAIGAFGEGEFWFHIDGGYTERPYRYTFLYAIELPSSGGNTMFSNMYKAYDAIPESLKRRLAGRKAIHVHEYNRAKQANHAQGFDHLPHFKHPVFITHPETGRKTLFVDRLMTVGIDGIDAHESNVIMQELYDIGERAEFIYEHEWQLGDFLMWDNRCSIHARRDFPKEERRLLRRCTVEGDLLHE